MTLATGVATKEAAFQQIEGIRIQKLSLITSKPWNFWRKQ